MKIDEKKLKEGAEKLGIKMVVLFGSRAGGKARENSDYDIAVLTTKEKNIADLDNYCDVLDFLRESLKIPDFKIDLTNLNTDNALLRYEVFSNGKLVYGDEFEYAHIQSFAKRDYIATGDLRELEKNLIYKNQKIMAEKIHA